MIVSARFLQDQIRNTLLGPQILIVSRTHRSLSNLLRDDLFLLIRQSALTTALLGYQETITSLRSCGMPTYFRVTPITTGNLCNREIRCLEEMGRLLTTPCLKLMDGFVRPTF